MTKQEKKAREITDMFFKTITGMIFKSSHHKASINYYHSKQCAILHVKGIMESNPTTPLTTDYHEHLGDIKHDAKNYWQEVLKAIETL